MKKFFIAIFLSIVVFWSGTPYFLYPQQVEAQWAVVDAPLALIEGNETIQTAIRYAEQVKKWYDEYKQYEAEYKRLGEMYVADVKGILGDYGLGKLSPIADKLLSGAGLDEILKDEVGGSIGLGGVLSGGLSGVMGREDMVSAVMAQYGVKIPPGTAEALKNKGILDIQGILKKFSGGETDNSNLVADCDFSKIRWVLQREGVGVSDQQISSMISGGALDCAATESQYIENPNASRAFSIGTASESGRPPCARWDQKDGKDTVCRAYLSSIPGSEAGGSLIQTYPSLLVISIFTYILSFIGGVALLMIMLSGYKLMTSKGKPEAIQEGREQLTAAIVGLMFIIFAFAIFQLIVVDILQIPGISK